MSCSLCATAGPPRQACAAGLHVVKRGDVAMWSLLFEQLQKCADIQSVLNCVLGRSLEVSGACFGNVQLMDWRSGYLEIKAQRGFQSEFLNFFDRVKVEDGSACARALRNCETIIIDDIMADEQLSPYREIACRAGVRAVQSVPLVSSGGAALGVLSIHFPIVHRPTDIQVLGMTEAAKLAANAIIHLRVANGDGKMLESRELLRNSLDLLRKSREAIVNAEKLLSRVSGARVN
jgi:GAF domain-containing protein